MMSRRDGSPAELTDFQESRLAAFRATTSLADLAQLVGADSEHDAYLKGKAEWEELRIAQLAGEASPPGLPGTAVAIGEQTFVVHGITHADTPAERERVRSFEAAVDPTRTSIFCEQGIRAMYFEDRPAVCEMDDYRWAMAECQELDGESHLDLPQERAFGGLIEEVDTIASTFRNAVFSVIDQYGGGEDSAVRATLGAVASSFLTSHEDLATGEDFEAFQKTRDAAADPSQLRELQNYYRRVFLPQPLEREWLQRHDPELEIMTHARNQRMAEYVVAEAGESETVHLLVGAAHQPGIAYYLRRIRDGEHSMANFEPIP